MPGRVNLIEQIFDRSVGALSAVWPRSLTAREVARLAREGYRSGATHEIEFSVTFDDGRAEAVVDDLVASGFTLRDRSASKPCCSVTAMMPLSAYHLHVTTARLQRVLAPHGGFAAVIGPVERGATSAARMLDPGIDLPTVRARA